MKNEYFKRTKKKLVGTQQIADELQYNKKFTHFTYKFDGTHAELHIELNGEVKFITRDGNDVSHLVPYLVKAISEWELRVSYVGVYAVELVHADKVINEPKDAWSASRRVLGCSDYNPNQPEIQCIIYDIHTRAYANVPEDNYLKRRLALPPILNNDSWLANKVSGLKNVYIPRLHDASFISSAWELDIIKRQGEGLMLINITKPCKWEDTFTKMKPLIDLDVIVMSYNKGTVGTKNEGKVGSINVGLYKEGEVTFIGKVPHMSDEERAFWTHRMVNNIDRVGDERFVLQVSCAEITTGNKMRFPNYVRERTDKRPEECLWSQLN